MLKINLIMQKGLIGKTKPEKASARVGINSFMMGSVFFMLTFILSSGANASYPIIFQLVLSVPLLFISSLAYSKISYWKENRLWDKLGWVTNHFGSWFLINVVGLLGAGFSRILGLFYFGLVIFLIVIYAIIKIKLNPFNLRNNLIKLALVLLTLYFGGIIFL